MSLKQISSLTLVALCLAACGSGGGGSGSRNNLNVPNGNDNSSNNGNKAPSFSVPKLLSVADLKEDAEMDLQEQFGSSAKLSSYAIKMDGKTYTRGDVNLATLGNGFKRVDVTETGVANINKQNHKVTQTSKLHLYQQPYSVVASFQITGGQVGDLGAIKSEEFEVPYFDGQPTKTLPAAGSFNYKGVAFNEKEQGNLDYTINFDTKKGAGSISGLSETGTITLHESNIVQGGREFRNTYATTNKDHDNKGVYGVLNGRATSEKQGNARYELGIFGPNADEIVGSVYKDGKDVAGFGGQKQ